MPNLFFFAAATFIYVIDDRHLNLFSSEGTASLIAISPGFPLSGRFLTNISVPYQMTRHTDAYRQVPTTSMLARNSFKPPNKN